MVRFFKVEMLFFELGFALGLINRLGLEARGRRIERCVRNYEVWFNFRFVICL